MVVKFGSVKSRIQESDGTLRENYKGTAVLFYTNVQFLFYFLLHFSRASGVVWSSCPSFGAGYIEKS